MSERREAQADMWQPEGSDRLIEAGEARVAPAGFVPQAPAGATRCFRLTLAAGAYGG